jgi:hypothetical protein
MASNNSEEVIVNVKFKPYVGRVFELKNYTDVKKYPTAVLVLDEKGNQVMFLDKNGLATWISKYYLRETPIKSKVFATTDTITKAFMLIEKLRNRISEHKEFYDLPDKQKKIFISKINKECQRVVQELRDLGSRTQGIEFAEPEVDDTISEEE